MIGNLYLVLIPLFQPNFLIVKEAPPECNPPDPPDPPDPLTMVSREQWGARRTRSATNISQPVPYVFIHHTAQDECHTQRDCARIMRGIQSFHMDDKGQLVLKNMPG